MFLVFVKANLMIPTFTMSSSGVTITTVLPNRLFQFRLGIGRPVDYYVSSVLKLNRTAQNKSESNIE